MSEDNVQEQERFISQSSNPTHGATPGRTETKGWSPRLCCSLAYFGAAFWFLLAVNLDYMPAAPWPLTGNLLPKSMLPESVNMVIWFIIMWGIHYARRFGEVLLLHDYRRKMSVLEGIGSNVYYWVFGLWIGWSLNFLKDVQSEFYQPPPMLLVVLGSLLFIIGEIGNCASHIQLRLLRKQNSNTSQATRSQHVIPKGLLFRFVSCPHYLFECITWIGYSVAIMTLSGFVFTLCSIITVFIYAYRHHQSYRKEFDGTDGGEKYPEDRKAIIPLIF